MLASVPRQDAAAVYLTVKTIGKGSYGVVDLVSQLGPAGSRSRCGPATRAPAPPPHAGLHRQRLLVACVTPGGGSPAQVQVRATGKLCVMKKIILEPDKVSAALKEVGGVGWVCLAHALCVCACGACGRRVPA